MQSKKNYFLNKWLPVLFLILIWYVPRNTAPGSIFGQFIFLRWITFIIIPIIVFIFLLYKYNVDSKIFVGNFTIPTIILFFVIILSALIHNSSLFVTVFTISLYIRYPLIFLFFLNINLNEDSLKLFLKVFFFLLIIQIPECYYRFFFLGIKQDYLSFTLGIWGTFDLGVYMTYATSLLVAKSLIIRFKLVYIILFLSFFFLSVIGEIKVYTIVAPIVTLFVILTCINVKMPKRRLYYIILVILVISTITILALDWWEIVFPKAAGFDNIRERQLPDGSSREIRRISAFFIILSTVDMEPINYYFGWGPGSSLVGSWGVDSGIFQSWNIIFKNQLAETFVDIGFLGLFAYYFLLSKIYFSLKKHYKIEYDKNYIFLNRALMGILLFYGILGPLYDLLWRYDCSNYIFFFLTAVMYSRYRELKIKVLY